jgi:predicted MPP superfamily phosphohydrolase
MMFVIVGVVGILGIHYYFWRRLIHSTTRPGRARRVATWVFGAFTVLIVLTLLGQRLLSWEAFRWLAWPGYLWLAVVFYLLLFLLALEIPRALALLTVRRTAHRARPGAVRSPEPGTDPGTGLGTSADTVRVGIAHGRPAASAEEALPVGERPGAERTTAGAPANGAAGADGRGGGSTVAAPSGAPGRRMFITRSAAAIAGVGALATVGFGVREALGDPVVRRVPVTLAKLDPRMSGLRIAVVSDIHLGPLTGIGHTRRITRMINELQADVVTIVGDLVDGTVAELGAHARPLGGLESRYGTYYVTGNHEYYTPNGPAEWEAELTSLGVRPLRNERVEISHGGGVLDLAGVNDLNGRSSGDGPDLGRALGGRDTSRPVVLLAHQPVQVEQAAGFGVDLQLSGHTHGGQIVPFDRVVALSQPVVAGLATVRGTQVYVTRGAGYWGPPVRVGAPPEIALMELRPGR